jgi:hypothetical protein
MDLLDIDQIVSLVRQEAWLPLVIFIVGYLVRLTADDSNFPVSIDRKWHSTVIAGLAWLYGLLVALPDWKKGLAPPMIVAVFVLGLRAYFTGRAEPTWLKWLAQVKTSPTVKRIVTDVEVKTSQPTASEPAPKPTVTEEPPVSSASHFVPAFPEEEVEISTPLRPLAPIEPISDNEKTPVSPIKKG